jgi:succinate-semialdehyde dehydrogenase/glutarate-semialdehyde dehydrogenase
VAQIYGSNWINGGQSTLGSDTTKTFNPATGDLVGHFQASDSAEVARAVEAAKCAQSGWWELGAQRRTELLNQVADNLRNSSHLLAEIESREMGKPIAMAQTDIHGSAEVIENQISGAIEFFAESSSSTGRLVRRPYGVAALITPWNYPVCQVTDVVGALLVAGNTVVVKPSEKAPLSVAALSEVFDCLPPGVFNIVLGNGVTGSALIENPDVDLVHFTGSVATGRKVGAVAGARLIPCFLELGGKDPLVIDEDVDIKWAAEIAVTGSLFNTGQVCTSVERIYVHKNIAEPFISELVAQASSWTIGPGSGPSNQLGPLIDGSQRDLVHEHVFEAQLKGAQVLIGGEPLPGPGFFYPPTVVLNPPDDSRLMTEETFGPVITVCVVESFEEGINRANVSNYGLSASALTKNPENIALASRLNAGAITINGGGTGPEDPPFEPVKTSGSGRIFFGPKSLESYTTAYAVNIGEAK